MGQELPCCGASESLFRGFGSSAHSLQLAGAFWEYSIKHSQTAPKMLLAGIFLTSRSAPPGCENTYCNEWEAVFRCFSEAISSFKRLKTPQCERGLRHFSQPPIAFKSHMCEEVQRPTCLCSTVLGNFTYLK